MIWSISSSITLTVDISQLLRGTRFSFAANTVSLCALSHDPRWMLKSKPHLRTEMLQARKRRKVTNSWTTSTDGRKCSRTDSLRAEKFQLKRALCLDMAFLTPKDRSIRHDRVRAFNAPGRQGEACPAAPPDPRRRWRRLSPAGKSGSEEGEPSPPALLTHAQTKVFF